MSEPIRVVSCGLGADGKVFCDPAIDRTASNLDEYMKTLDPRHLVFIEGRRAIWYQIADLHYLDYQDCLAVAAYAGLVHDRAFRFGVIGIEGVSIGGGDASGCWRPVHERTRDGETVKTITSRDMAAIFKVIAPRHILGIGRLIAERAEAERPGNGAGGAG